MKNAILRFVMLIAAADTRWRINMAFEIECYGRRKKSHRFNENGFEQRADGMTSANVEYIQTDDVIAIKHSVFSIKGIEKNNSRIVSWQRMMWMILHFFLIRMEICEAFILFYSFIHCVQCSLDWELFIENLRNFWFEVFFLFSLSLSLLIEKFLWSIW